MASVSKKLVMDDSAEKFVRRINGYIDQVRLYEDPIRQESARKTVPVEELQEKALVSLAKEGKYEPSKLEQDHAFLLQLLFWFKQLFRWVNAPSCEHCGDATTFQDMGDPLPSELQFGANRVEVYGCNSCQMVTRFPRFNDPIKLIETRRGRCGEWANCFTFYCRVFGYESRF
ncbi:peptide-N(4)-(N-acetyl-beta-glucosaminyl)asparagine amidase-like, partial [Cucurbita pepo subsp. pepo]|uniref:peptide-N(4)-(N-acetyl-beta- glucosaminyl)asparagine amidase-like n=1 Tax=Cucurbita pepo subsp. pepo TaxID=3664 RepID=UPI000C9D939B